jgi:serine protease AprX
VAGLPPEVSGDFDPPIVVPTGSSDLNIAAPDSADTGFYDLTNTATEMTGGKQIQHGTQAVLRVTPPRDFTIQVQPDSQDVQASFSVDFDVILTSLWGFASPCSLAVSGLPLGASAGFDPNPCPSVRPELHCREPTC